MSEVLSQVGSHGKDGSDIKGKQVKNLLPTFQEIKSFFKISVLGGILGVLIGIIPGTGGRNLRVPCL